jgi:ABC-2 type transport system ATP-binding protein
MYETSVRHTNNGSAPAAPPVAAPVTGLLPPEGGVITHGLGKRYGDLWALRDLDLAVSPGTVLGLLGHNGAGKTTAIRILTTLSSPTEGSATVAGLDVVAHPGAVQRRIGVAAQQATVDGLMTGRANLEMVGRLHRLSKAKARQRADELLERLDLADSADQLAKNFSGGMRRRLDLAASLVSLPEVLFLDEPTTGLDPRSRNELWEVLRGLVREGTTILLTTQYLEEADQLADDIVVLDHGLTVAHGSPDELKAEIGNDRIDVKVPSADEMVNAARALAGLTSGPPTFDDDDLVATIPIVEGVSLMQVMRALDAAGVDAIDLNRRQATLDDVFLALTSPSSTDSSPATAEEVSR